MIRVASVRYLNAAPLVTHLDPARFEVSFDHPRGVAHALASGACDVALAPVAAVLTDADLRVLPGLCIGAYGPVQSVLLLAETPPEAWTELVLDGESRTSVTLATLLQRHGRLGARADLPITTVEPGAAPARIGGTVAGLVIGDTARTLAPRYAWRLDLAQLWTAWTGLPFVFAVWAARPDLDPAIAAEIVAAGRAGLDARGLTWADSDLSYLTDAIRYPLDEPALMGLRRYAALAHRAGLIGHAEVPLLDPPRIARERQPALDRLLADAADGARLEPDALARLADSASDADLRLAASLRRADLHGASTAGYLVRDEVDTATELATALQAPLARRVTAVRLVGLEGLPHALQTAWLRATEEADLDVCHVDLAALEAHGGAWAHGPAAGLWDPNEGRSEALLHDLLAGGWSIEARWTVDPRRPLRESLGALLAIRRTSSLAACSVALALPTGSLVEPGRNATTTWLRAISLARLALPEVPHLVSSTETQGMDLAQISLTIGADDLGPIGHLLPRAGSDASFVVDIEEAERVLRVGGLQPVRRSPSFQPVGDALTHLRTIRRPEERARP